MIPITLRLAGFLSYAEPVEVDFTAFDLACISGSNGAGKSSLLDAITWALFGIARKRDDSIINSRKKTAEVSFQFEYEKNIYRIRRSRTEGKTSLLEFFVQSGDAWNVLTEATLSRTEERIRKTLRLDYETFTNASFFLQGKADQFAQQPATERKRILTNILGLEIWEEYRERATDKRKSLENDLDAENARLEEIRAELDQADARRLRLTEIQAQLDQYSLLRQSKEALVITLRKQAASLDEQKKMVDLWRNQELQKSLQVEQLTTKIAELESEKNNFETIKQHDKEIESQFQQWQQDAAALQKTDTLAANFHQHQARRAEPLIIIEKEKSRLEQLHNQLMQGQAQALGLEEALPILQAEQARLIQEQNLLEAQVATRPELENTLRLLQEKQATLASENTRLKQDMAELKERINRLTASTSADCPLCGQPLETDDRQRLIEQLQTQGTELGDRFRTNQTDIKAADEEQRQIHLAAGKLDTAQEQLRGLLRLVDQGAEKLRLAEETLQMWKKDGEPQLKIMADTLASESFSQTARQELQTIDDELRAMGYDPAEHDRLREQEQSGRIYNDRMLELEKARAALKPLQRQLEDTRLQLETAKIELAEIRTNFEQANTRYEKEKAELPDVQQAEREYLDSQEEENKLHMLVGAAKQSVDVLDVIKKRQGDIETRLLELRLMITRYKSLEKACGKDGVPALLIEQALPELETQANDILDRLSAGSMSVRFITQADYKTKKREDKKETLEIMIHDSVGTRAYELFSGGEAFRVNFAIRLALARVLAQRAGARLQTLVIDEGFGSQDSQGKQRLIEAINLVRHDFAKILVITHLEELKDAFPARIEVEKIGLGSTVRVIA